MVMVMTATPLAILGCGLPESDITPVIQWHVVGMFAPSFFSGSLIKRYGAPRMMQIGFVLLLGHVFITLLGIEFLHFLRALPAGRGMEFRLRGRNGPAHPVVSAIGTIESADDQRVHDLRPSAVAFAFFPAGCMTRFAGSSETDGSALLVTGCCSRWLSGAAEGGHNEKLMVDKY